MLTKNINFVQNCPNDSEYDYYYLKEFGNNSMKLFIKIARSKHLFAPLLIAYI